jgi:hypothetical protein
MRLEFENGNLQSGRRILGLGRKCANFGKDENPPEPHANP